MDVKKNLIWEYRCRSYGKTSWNAYLLQKHLEGMFEYIKYIYHNLQFKWNTVNSPKVLNYGRHIINRGQEIQTSPNGKN